MTKIYVFKDALTNGVEEYEATIEPNGFARLPSGLVYAGNQYSLGRPEAIQIAEYMKAEMMIFHHKELGRLRELKF